MRVRMCVRVILRYPYRHSRGRAYLLVLNKSPNGIACRVKWALASAQVCVRVFMRICLACVAVMCVGVYVSANSIIYTAQRAHINFRTQQLIAIRLRISMRSISCAPLWDVSLAINCWRSLAPAAGAGIWVCCPFSARPTLATIHIHCCNDRQRKRDVPQGFNSAYQARPNSPICAPIIHSLMCMRV